jgi:hypothetical protein
MLIANWFSVIWNIYGVIKETELKIKMNGQFASITKYIWLFLFLFISLKRQAFLLLVWQKKIRSACRSDNSFLWKKDIWYLLFSSDFRKKALNFLLDLLRKKTSWFFSNNPWFLKFGFGNPGNIYLSDCVWFDTLEKNNFLYSIFHSSSMKNVVISFIWLE